MEYKGWRRWTLVLSKVFPVFGTEHPRHPVSPTLLTKVDNVRQRSNSVRRVLSLLRFSAINESNPTRQRFSCHGFLLFWLWCFALARPPCNLRTTKAQRQRTIFLSGPEMRPTKATT